MNYCEQCRQRGGYPISTQKSAGICEFCGFYGAVNQVPAASIPLPGELISSPSTPFEDPPIDPRAQAIQDARDEMASGRGATTSLPPNYELLKELVKWMYETGWAPYDIANAVWNPKDYWPHYHKAKDSPNGP